MDYYAQKRPSSALFGWFGNILKIQETSISQRKLTIRVHFSHVDKHNSHCEKQTVGLDFQAMIFFRTYIIGNKATNENYRGQDFSGSLQQVTTERNRLYEM